MKKILIILLFLITSFSYAQKPKVDYIRYKKYTTAQKNAIDVTDTSVTYIVFDTDLDRFQKNSGSGWVDYFSSGGGAGDMTKAVYDPTGINADAFDYNNFYNTPTIPTTASQIGFTPYLTLSSTDLQLAMQEQEDELKAAVLDVASLKLEEDLTAVGGETSWVLTNTPSTGYIPQLYIGGILQKNGTDYSISGNTVSFLGINNPLVAGDEVHIEYNDVSAPTPYNLEVKDEGISTVASATKLNFVGSNVTVTDAGSGEATVTVSGSGATNLSTTQSSTDVTINSDTGTNASIPLGNGTNAGVSINDYTTAEKNKLAAITGTNTGDQDLSNYVAKTGFSSISARFLMNGSNSPYNLGVNTVNDIAIQTYTTGTGKGIDAHSTGTGTSIYSVISSSGNGIVSNGLTGSTGKLFQATLEGSERWSVDTGGNVLGNSFNGVALTTAGSSTAYLSADGTYTTPAVGGDAFLSANQTWTGLNTFSSKTTFNDNTADSNVLISASSGNNLQINNGVASATGINLYNNASIAGGGVGFIGSNNNDADLIVLNGATASTGRLFVTQNNGVETSSITKQGDITANSVSITGGTGSNVLLDDGTTTPVSGLGGGSSAPVIEGDWALGAGINRYYYVKTPVYNNGSNFYQTSSTNVPLFSNNSVSGYGITENNTITSIKGMVSSTTDITFNLFFISKHLENISADLNITSASTTLTSTSYTFVSGDVGKNIVIQGAGASGAALVTTIASFTDANTVEVTNAASTTVSNANGTLETNTELYSTTTPITVNAYDSTVIDITGISFSLTAGDRLFIANQSSGSITVMDLSLKLYK